MTWLTQIEIELERSKPGENPGRTRTIARRVAGIALQQLQNASSQKIMGDNYITLLQGMITENELPAEVVEAATRLQTRIDADHNSPAVNPIQDAMIIVEFVKKNILNN